MATSVLEKEVTKNVAVAERTITVCGMAGQIAPLGSGHVHLSAFTGIAVLEKPVERRFVGGMAGYVYPCPQGSPGNSQTRIFGLGNSIDSIVSDGLPSKAESENSGSLK